MKITFTARLLVYCGVLLYVALDLYGFAGPLRKAINRRKSDSPEFIEEAKKWHRRDGARAPHHHGTGRSRRTRADVAGRKAWKDTTPEQRTLVRKAVLAELVDHQLIRSKIAANKDAARASEEEISDRIKQLLARFVSREDMEQSMHAQGIATEQELRLRMAAMIEMENTRSPTATTAGSKRGGSEGFLSKTPGFPRDAGNAPSAACVLGDSRQG